MVIIHIFALLFTISAYATPVIDAFKAKDSKRVSEIYRDAPKADYSSKELIMISHSLRKMGYYRQDINLNIRLIKKNYLEQHKKILTAIKNGDSIDGEEYPKPLKIHYWNVFTDYGVIIMGYKDVSNLISKDHEHFLRFSKILGDLEFREGKVDKANDKVLGHIQYLQNKVYRFIGSLYFNYVSWQQSSKLVGASSTDLIVTNKGYCLGGDLGMENAFYHVFMDGCFLFGSGGVSSTSTSPNYRQRDVPAYGVKVGPGASMIVSSTRSRIGFKLPIIYTVQRLSEPKDGSYKIDPDSPLSAIGTLYSRWQFDKWYFQTEFGKYLTKDQSFWGLGFGRNF